MTLTLPLSHTHSQMQDKTSTLERVASSIGDTDKDIKVRIGKAREDFNTLKKI